jgi:5,10-methenyltetrahydromethanopterin hydrogenase
MAATFTWTIATCERNVSDGGVIVAHWRCNAEETVGAGDDAITHSAASYGTQSLTPDASADGFVPYDSLTEDTVKAWIWAEDVDKDAIENSLQQQINEFITPPTATGVPW